MSKIEVCDICKKTRAQPEHGFSMTYLQIGSNHHPKHLLLPDVCDDCADNIKDHIKSMKLLSHKETPKVEEVVETLKEQDLRISTKIKNWLIKG